NGGLLTDRVHTEFAYVFPFLRPYSMSSISIRRLSADLLVDKASWAAVRDICCRTGDNGRPIAAERWEFFSQLWIEPYQKLVPEWTYVAVASESIVGYLTGYPNSKEFFRRKTLTAQEKWREARKRSSE